MNQDTLFEEENTKENNENTYGIRAKIIGIGGAGISLVDGLRFDNFDCVDNLVMDVDMKAISETLASQKIMF